MHNIRNATAAAAVSFTIGISSNMIKKGLKNFKGVQRRFNILFEYKNSKFVDDYAHHPTEIKAVLDSVKKVYKQERIICIFQPHRISRLNYLKKNFEKCFQNADLLVLCPIYRAGENIKLKFKYETFAKEIIKNSDINVIMIKNKNDLIKFVKQNVFFESLVVGMGAGSISSWMRNLQSKLK